VSHVNEQEYDFNRLFGGTIMSPVPAPYGVFARLRSSPSCG
jgi:hypothetical protein